VPTADDCDIEAFHDLAIRATERPLFPRELRGPLQKRHSVNAKRIAVFLLAATPIVMLSLAVPLVNRVDPRVFGLPFVLFWIVAWVVLTPAILFAIHRLEDRR
jgi:uncharacterized protein DUF3311